jgi:hypothetical protein
MSCGIPARVVSKVRKHGMDADIDFGWREVILRLAIFLVNCIIGLNGHLAERIAVLQNSISDNQIVATIQHAHSKRQESKCATGSLLHSDISELLDVDFSLAALSLNLSDQLTWMSRLGLVKTTLKTAGPHKTGRS